MFKRILAVGFIIFCLTGGAEAANLKDWVGHWKDGENTIDITKSPEGKLDVDAFAMWRDHIGEIQGIGTPVNNQLEIKMDNCVLHLTLQGGRLIARDNASEVEVLDCAGANVYFSGTYHRRLFKKPHHG